MRCIRLLSSVFIVLVFICIPFLASAQTSGKEFYERGNKFYNTQKYSEAISAYQKAIQLNPKSQLNAYLNCARAYNMMKDYVQAQRYYEFYLSLDPNAKNDRKVKGELSAVEKKAARLAAYVIPDSQRIVLDQLQATLKENGPILTAQNGGALALYDVLLRTGYAEPGLIQFQEKIAAGLYQEILSDVAPVTAQALPALDRMGWERVRNKLQRLSQFVDVNKDSAHVLRLEKTAIGWETYYRGEYLLAEASFREAITGDKIILAAYWGRMMAALQTKGDESVLANIDETDRAYDTAKHVGVKPYLNVVRAQVNRNIGKLDESLRLLESI